MIKTNAVNIIWNDNPFIDINSISYLFDSACNKNYSIISIVHRTDTVYYVSINPFKYFDKYEDKSINNLMCDNYYINCNAYSSIRYIINSIILINEWLFYIDNK